MERRQAAAKKGAATRKRNSVVAQAAERRESWGAENPARFTSLGELHEQQLLGDSAFHEQMKRAGLDPATEAAKSRGTVEKMGTRQFYSAMGYSEIDKNSTEASNNAFQGTLFEHPDTVKNPSRWEDLSDKERARTLKSLEERGVTEESASQAIGARMDKAFV